MGTEIEIFLPKDEFFSEEKASLATTQVFEEFRRLESIFSRFQSDSELSHLNRVRESFISEELQQVLTFSLQIAHETNGVFNPLVNLSALGYSNDFWSKNFERKNAKALCLHYDGIRIHNGRVSLPENAFLDLGGCAKGYSVDKGVAILDTYFPHFLLNAGGDLFARGRFHEETWNVGIANPKNEEENIFVISLQDEALATSGSYRRKWDILQETYHHLVNGTTNTNSDTYYESVSVQTSSVLLADTFATTAFLLGEEHGQAFLAERNAIGYFA